MAAGLRPQLAGRLLEALGELGLAGLMGAECVVCQQLRQALAVLEGVALLLAVLGTVELKVSEEADALHARRLVAASERLLHGGEDDVVVELVA